jgi:Domain of unknown function (DUF4157)
MEAARTKTPARAAAPAPVPAARPVRAVVPPGQVQLQSALKVSSPGEAAEKEAEATAARVVRRSGPDRPPAAPAAGPGGPPRRGLGPLQSTYVSRFRGAVGATGPVLVASRQAAGPPRVTPRTAADIAAAGSGAPLPESERRFMEQRFGADFSRVRIHTGERAARLSRQLNAQAFTVGNQIFFGRDRFRPGSPEGRELLAHELTHTIQQGAAVQRSVEPGPPVTERSAPQVQRLSLGAVADRLASWANAIPGYRMFTIVLGVNPINMSRVDRSPANVLRAVVEFIPGGFLITRALDNYGVFDRVGTWVEQQLRTLGITGDSIRRAIAEFVEPLGLSDIVLDPGGVWDRAVGIFTGPIERIKSFVSGLASAILGFIKDAILRPLGQLAADKVPGWDLLKAVLGRDPVTGESAQPDGEALIGAFMKLIGQQEVYENLKKANALKRAGAWFKSAVGELLSFVSEIPSVFLQALRDLTIEDVILLPLAFVKVGRVFAGFATRFASWAVSKVLSLLEIIFDVVAPSLMPYLRQAAGSILRNPIGFGVNLVRAVRLGVVNFGASIGVYFKAALIDWLTGSLPGVYIPKSFELSEFVKFVFSVLGLSWQNVRAKLVKVIGETAVLVLEETFDIVVTLVKDGPAAAWDKIKEHLANLRDQVVGGIVDMVVDLIAKKAIPQLAALFIPGAGFISAIIKIYDTIQTVRSKLSRIAQVVGSVVNSIAAIAAGDVAGPARRVETALAGLLSPAISILASFAGLGKVADKVMGVIQKIRAKIDKALDALVGWIVTAAKTLGKLVVVGAKKLLGWWKARIAFSADAESHSLYFQGERASATLVVASSPLPIEAFLASKQAEAKADNEKHQAIGAIRALLAKANVLIQKVKKDEQNEQLQRDIESTMNAMAVPLIKLLSTKEWGTPENPAPIAYEKRRAAAYPTFLLASGDLIGLKQPELRTRLGQKALKGRIWECRPTVQTAIPGESPLGLAAASQIEVGKKIEFKETGSRGGKVGAFKRMVERYGLKPSENGWDVDHVIELQIGGVDEFANLWPLPAGENRSSGSLIKEATTNPAGQAPLAVSAAFQLKKTKSKPLWLIVTSTRQR